MAKKPTRYKHGLYQELKDKGFSTKWATNMATSSASNIRSYINAVEKGIPTEVLENANKRGDYLKREGKRSGEFEFKNWQKEKKARWEYVKKHNPTDTTLTKEEMESIINKKTTWEEIKQIIEEPALMLDFDKRNEFWSKVTSEENKRRSAKRQGKAYIIPKEYKMSKKMQKEAEQINKENGYPKDHRFGFAVLNHIYTAGMTKEKAVDEVLKIAVGNTKYE